MNLLDWIATLLTGYNSRLRNHLTTVENFQNFAKFKTPSRFTRLSIIKTPDNPLTLTISDYKETWSLFSLSISFEIFLLYKFKYKTLNSKYNFISNIITYHNFKDQTFQNNFIYDLIYDVHILKIRYSLTRVYFHPLIIIYNSMRNYNYDSPTSFDTKFTVFQRRFNSLALI